MNPEKQPAPPTPAELSSPIHKGGQSKTSVGTQAMADFLAKKAAEDQQPPAK
ncbi:hypothetical protein RBE51_21195 [Pseudomonas taiwanensis]|uniref:hypothetical protein n=1 Tax=Pseudomonas taiwanensis TaxID=470150 RepID=UPI0028DDA1A6|nr:hypothetical protein [Pseudomonas taiwanensis]MDT8925314.1 hypothetical protein [Pseudomonas taiwanensis]